jgi:ABC-type arginine transport system permease subunit
MSKGDYIVGFKMVFGVSIILFSLFFGVMLGGASIFYYASGLPQKVSVSDTLRHLSRDVSEVLPVFLLIVGLLFVMQRLLSFLAGDTKRMLQLDIILTACAIAGLLAGSTSALFFEKNVQW